MSRPLAFKALVPLIAGVLVLGGCSSASKEAGATTSTTESTTQTSATSAPASVPGSAPASGTGPTSGAAETGTKCATTDTLTASMAIAWTIFPIQLGEQTGIFAKHCLKIEESDVTAPPASIAALLGGSADVIQVPVNNIITTAAQGVPLRIIGPNMALPTDAKTLDPKKYDPTGLYAAKGSSIASPKDLAGKTVGVPSRGTQLEMSVAAAVQADGGDPTKINWVVLDQPTMIQQLKANKIDAATVTAPFTSTLEADGYTRTFALALALMDAGSTYSVWVTSANTLAAKHDALQRFHDAIIEVNQYAVAHQDEAMQVIADKTKTPLATIKAGPSIYVGVDFNMDRDVTPVAQKLLKLGYIKQIPDLSAAVGIG